MNKYSTSICAIAKNETEYLIEWIEHHLSIGIDHFFIIDNESKIPVSDTLKKYQEYITVSYMKKYPDSQNFVYTQYVTYLHNTNLTQWCAFIDVDEFLVFKEENNLSIKNYLSEYENYGGVGINWEVLNANGHITKPSGKLKDNFKKIYRSEGTIKTIANIKYTKAFYNPHYANYVDKKYCIDERFNIISNQHNSKYKETTKLKLYHYFTKSFEEWLEKLKKGPALNVHTRQTRFIDEFWKYNPELVPKKQEILDFFAKDISEITNIYSNLPK